MSDDYENNDMPVFPTEPATPEKPEAHIDDTVTEEPVPNIAQETPVQPVYAAPPADPIPQEIPVQPVTSEPDYAEQVKEAPSQTPYTAPQYSGASSDTQPINQTTYPNMQQGYSQYNQYQQPYNGTYAGSAYNHNASPYSQNYGAPQYPYQQQFQQPAPQPPKKSNKGLKVFFTLLAVVVVLAIVFTCVAFFGYSRRNNNETSTVTDANGSTVVTNVDGNAPVVETQSSPSSDSKAAVGAKVLTPVQIAAKVKPSIVGIVVYANTASSAASEGSGILWKEDDAGYTYIITCAHVINGSGYTFTVQTEDGTQYDAEKVGLDTKTDLGILKIKKTGLKLAEFGDSGALQVGDSVYAVGNPGGTEFFGSFTSGVVSAIDRSVKSTYTMVCIQHDAAINPGNSGGALVNNYGQVVGINSLKIINTEYEGMGFAIPIKSAQSIINSLAKHGYVPDRAKLGITYAEAIDYQQYSMIVKIKGLPSGSLIITKIGSDSALAGTSAKQYDMIIAVDGKELTTPDVLLDKIDDSKAGDEVTLTLCRIDNNYKTTEFDVKVKLVEDKGVEAEETTTSPMYSFDPYDFFGIN